MQVSIAIYQSKVGPRLEMHTLGLGPLSASDNGRGLMKVQQRLLDHLRRQIAKLYPESLTALELIRGRRLHRLRLELSLRADGERRRLSGIYPVVVEPHPLGDAEQLLIGYHPKRQDEWFPVDPDKPLDELASAYFQRAWARLPDWEIHGLVSSGRDVVRVVSFEATPRTLADKLRKTGEDDDRPAALLGGRRVKGGLLAELGTNQTIKAVDSSLEPGMPRNPYRQQLGQLLCGSRKAPVLLVGPPGVGKSTLVHQLVFDLLDADDYPSHQNLDRVHRVWKLGGRRIIAGMSYLGQWEERCVDLLDEIRNKRIVLWVDDIHAWGRIGESRSSDRSLSMFFRGPLVRGEVHIVAECTPEEYQRLQDDDAAFAACFTVLHVPATDGPTTMRMLVHTGRALELAHDCAFDPRAYRSIYELTASVYAGAAFPGKAIDLARALAVAQGEGDDRAARRALLLRGRPLPSAIGSSDVIEMLSGRTGIPALLLDPDRELDATTVAEEFRRQVIGQPHAVRAARDLVVRLKSNLTDDDRPFAVYLFTGPTGTGKTEMAKAIAAYLYGDERRLVRLDMSEFSSPDAVSRLIGDRFDPDGVLTSRVRVQPFSVVLLDEVEKAHPSVLNLMLQLFDDGRLSDASGKVADFRRAVIVMTSNLGASSSPSVGFDDETASDIEAAVRGAIRGFFPPELFNRIDRVVPFAPLGVDAARSIARKELTRLLGRRGLTGRNIFVRVTDGVVDKTVSEGFTARDGARSLKRYLEDNIASALTDRITATGAASMRVFWAYTAAGGFRLHEEALREAPPLPGDVTALDPRPSKLAELLAALPQARRHLVALEAEVSAATSRPAPTGDGAHVYDFDRLADDVRSLREAVDIHLAYDDRLAATEPDDERSAVDGELLEADRFPREHRTNPDRFGQSPRTRRRTDRRHMTPALPLANRRQVAAALDRVRFLRFAVQKCRDPRQNTVFIELSRVGQPGGTTRFAPGQAGLLEWLASAYAAAHHGRFELESIAAMGTSNRVEAFGPDRLESALATHPRRLVLELSGPAVRPFFAGDQGCQIRHSLSGGTEIVRVRVSEAKTKEDAAAALRRAFDDRTAFEAALSGTTPLPENPDAMLPVIRRFHWDPPGRDGTLTAIEVEDYPLAHVVATQVRTLTETLPSLWMRRLAQQEAGR